MRVSTSYLLAAIVFLLVSAYLILAEVTLTFFCGVGYTAAGVREQFKERKVRSIEQSA